MLYEKPFVYVNDLFLDPEAQTLQSYIMAIGQFQQDIHLWGISSVQFSSVQLLSRVRLFATP